MLTCLYLINAAEILQACYSHTFDISQPVTGRTLAKFIRVSILTKFHCQLFLIDGVSHIIGIYSESDKYGFHLAIRNQLHIYHIFRS